MPNIADIRTRVVPRIKDAALSLDPVNVTTSIDAAIASAVSEYSNVKPNTTAAIVNGTGAFKYSLTAASPVLAGFDPVSSVVTNICYPYNAAVQNPPNLDADEWQIRRLNDGLWLWFLINIPGASETFLAEYTAPHTVSASVLTVAPSDYEAVSDLSAAHALLMLADFYIQSIDGSIAADSVNRLSKAQEYRAAAKTFRDAYDLKMSSGVATGPALAIGDMDRNYSDPYQVDYHFHGRRRF